MGSPIDRTAKTALDSNLVNGVTSDAPKVKSNNDVLYNYADTLNSALDTHAAATTLPHADSSVTGPKIRDGAVTTAKIADLAVTRTKLAVGAVGTSQLDPTLLTDFGSIAVQAEFDRRGVNVMKYGAVGDGVTDDTAAIQAAANSLPTAESPINAVRGGILFLPPGKYKITAPITIMGGTVVMGAGRDATIVDNATTDSDSFKVLEIGTHNAYNISFRDIQINGSQAATAGKAINVGYGFTGVGTVACAFERVDIFGHFNGIAIGNSINVKIDNVMIQNCASDGMITSGTSNVVTVINTYTSFCGGHGYNITGSNYCSFLNTASDSNGGDGYHLVNTNRLGMVSAGAEVNTGHALSVSGGTSTSISLMTCYFNPCVDDVILLNNVVGASIINCDGLSTGSGKYGLNLTGTTSNVVVMGGYFQASLGVTNNYLKCIFLNFAGTVDTSFAVGAFAEAGKSKFVNSVGDDVLQIAKSGVADYTFCIDSAQTFKIRVKNTTNYPFKISALAPNNAVSIAAAGTIDSLYGVVLYSPNNTRYKIVVDNAGVLSTVLA